MLSIFENMLRTFVYLAHVIEGQNVLTKQLLTR